MKKQDLLLISICFILIAYLLIQLYQPPLRLNSSVNLKSLNIPQNTKLVISGTPENIKKYTRTVNFEIGNVSVKANSRINLNHQNISVIGLVREYNNQTYLEAIKIKYVY